MNEQNDEFFLARERSAKKRRSQRKQTNLKIWFPHSQSIFHLVCYTTNSKNVVLLKNISNRFKHITKRNFNRYPNFASCISF